MKGETLGERTPAKFIPSLHLSLVVLTRVQTSYYIIHGLDARRLRRGWCRKYDISPICPAIDVLSSAVYVSASVVADRAVCFVLLRNIYYSVIFNRNLSLIHLFYRKSLYVTEEVAFEYVMIFTQVFFKVI